MSERLTPIEAIMWRAGQDPGLRMTVGNLMILDRAPTREELEERIAAAAADMPRLRWRPDDASVLRGRPAWVDEDGFEGRAHLGVVAVPAPGSQRQLLDLLSMLETRPFDADRSPWDATLIEGVEGGRAALYLRAHHALTDGLGGIALLSALLDHDEASPEPDPTSGAAVTAEPAGPADAPEPPAVAVAVGATGGRRPGTVTLSVDLTRAAGAAREAAAAARTVDPLDTIARVLQRGLDTASSVAHQVVVVGGPLSSLPPSALAVQPLRDRVRAQREGERTCVGRESQ